MKNLNDYEKRFDKGLKVDMAVFVVTLILAILISCAFIFTACNKNVFDFTYNYDYAYIKLQNGEVIEGHVSSWADYEDGDQLQITIDGVTYLVHASNCTLVYYGEQI